MTFDDEQNDIYRKMVDIFAGDYDKPKRPLTDALGKLELAANRLTDEQTAVAEWRASKTAHLAMLNSVTYVGDGNVRKLYGIPVTLDDTLGEGIAELVSGDIHITVDTR